MQVFWLFFFFSFSLFFEWFKGEELFSLILFLTGCFWLCCCLSLTFYFVNFDLFKVAYWVGWSSHVFLLLLMLYHPAVSYFILMQKWDKKGKVLFLVGMKLTQMGIVAHLCFFWVQMLECVEYSVSWSTFWSFYCFSVLLVWESCFSAKL